jgi:hypothetical protein
MRSIGITGQLFYVLLGSLGISLVGTKNDKPMIELFQISLFISLFCVGLRIISSPGLILYFLRKPYDNLNTELKRIVANVTNIDKDIANHEEAKEKIKLTAAIKNQELSADQKGRIIIIQKHIDDQWVERGKMVMKQKPVINKINILKPIIGCGTCMASVWTLIWFIPGLYLAELNLNVLFIFPTMFIVAAMNSLFYALYELMTKKEKSNCGG